MNKFMAGFFTALLLVAFSLYELNKTTGNVMGTVCIDHLAATNWIIRTGSGVIAVLVVIALGLTVLVGRDFYLRRRTE